jgi:hypothetical protein
MLPGGYRRPNFSLLGERINHIKRDVDAISQELMELRLCLARDLFADDVDLLDGYNGREGFTRL